MPFKSKAQMRACYAKDDPDWDCKEWSDHTKNTKDLPEKKSEAGLLRDPDPEIRPTGSVGKEVKEQGVVPLPTQKGTDRQEPQDTKRWDPQSHHLVETGKLTKMTDEQLKQHGMEESERGESYTLGKLLLPKTAEKKSEAIPGGTVTEEDRKEVFQAASSSGDAHAELQRGITVELEHTSDKEVAKEIAADHLAEDPAYYSKLETIDPHHKTADVNNLSEMTTMDATPRGNENHVRLTRNPYYGPLNDPQDGVDYENGYQYAQQLGHVRLGQISEDNIATWANQPVPWREGLAEGARRLGMGRVADMLEAASATPKVARMGETMTEYKMSAFDPNAETRKIPRGQAKTERIKKPDPRTAVTRRMGKNQNQVPTQRMTKSAAPMTASFNTASDKPRPALRPRKVDTSASAPKKLPGSSGPTWHLQDFDGKGDVRSKKIAEKEDKNKSPRAHLFRPAVVSQQDVKQCPETAGVEKKEGAMSQGASIGSRLGGMAGLALPVAMGAMGGDALAEALGEQGISDAGGYDLDTALPVAGGVAGMGVSPVTGALGSLAGGAGGAAMGGAIDLGKGVAQGARSIGRMGQPEAAPQPETAAHHHGAEMQGMSGEPQRFIRGV